MSVGFAITAIYSSPHDCAEVAVQTPQIQPSGLALVSFDDESTIACLSVAGIQPSIPIAGRSSRSGILIPTEEMIRQYAGYDDGNAQFSAYAENGAELHDQIKHCLNWTTHHITPGIGYAIKLGYVGEVQSASQIVHMACQEWSQSWNPVDDADAELANLLSGS